MTARIYRRFDPALTRRAVEAKLIAEGFTGDTDWRRMLVDRLSGVSARDAHPLPGESS